MGGAEFYENREQTLVKHEILKHYLERFAFIVGSKWDTITYVVCFAGPWNVQSPDLSDSSFAIALKQLRNARNAHAERGRQINLRCFFLEKDPTAFAKLQAFANSIDDVEVKFVNAEFEHSIADILAFVRAGGASSFPFIFIDPQGWTGVEISTIAPLLKLKPGEVLVNFMTDFIKRFVTSPNEQSQASFTRLFGSEEARQRVQSAKPEEREEVAVEEYCRGLKLTGEFEYTCCAYVLRPLKDRTFFHLIYATRKPRGVEVFKETERKAMEVMEQARGAAGIRQKEEQTGQMSLLSDDEDLPTSRHYDSLRKRFLSRGKAAVETLLKQDRRLLYDTAWDASLGFPLVWESDLKLWIQDWRISGNVTIDGLGPRQRVPKRGQNHVLVWSD